VKARLFVIALFALLALAFRPIMQAAGIEEPWATLIFVLLVPVIVQGVKFVADKKGAVVAGYVSQGISILIAFGYVLVTGGFAALILPLFPVWGGDVVGFALGILTYAGEWAKLLLLAAGSIEIAYRLVLKALMEKAGFATRAQIAQREAKR
jgi:hypothetical protein